MTHYRLASQVTLRTNPDGGGSLFVSHPQRIIKLSQGGMTALRQVCAGESEHLSPPVLEFVHNLENQGIIIREFPQIENDPLPLVSIIIPTYGRPQMLAGCLESLTALDYPADRLEIIIVDDASPQPVSSENWHPEVKLMRQTENRGPGAARNGAVREAKGEIIAFLDDDCLADRNWLKALVPAFQHQDVAIAGGKVESAELSNSLAKYEQVQSPLLMGTFQRKVRKGSALSYLPTCNLLIRKTVFQAVGGFDPNLRLGEDVDLCWRVLDSGANIYYLPTGVVYHYHRTRLISFLKRRYNYGQSEAKLQGKHRQESRRLSLFSGHRTIFPAALLIVLVFGVLFGKNRGLFLGITSLVVFDVFNLAGQIALRLHRIKSSGYRINFGQVCQAITRAHNSSFYLYCQHFSRYYSIILTIIALLLFPLLAVLFLIMQLWPAVVDYRLKKPSIQWAYYLFFYTLENYCYQAGVLNGCWRERNWRPLVMEVTNFEEIRT